MPAGTALDGVSWKAWLEGKPLPRKQPLYWQYDKAISKPWQVALRDGPWKLLADGSLEKFALYNLADDLREQKDLAKTRAGTRAAAGTRLKRSIAPSTGPAANRLEGTAAMRDHLVNSSLRDRAMPTRRTLLSRHQGQQQQPHSQGLQQGLQQGWQHTLSGSNSIAGSTSYGDSNPKQAGPRPVPRAAHNWRRVMVVGSSVP